jgi:hypothetical protein
MLLRALLAATLSSLAGVLVWQALGIANMAPIVPTSLDTTSFMILGVLWLYALYLTIVIGLPVAFLASLAMRRLAIERWWLYILTGTSAAALFASLDSLIRAAFWIPMATTGGVLGALYWRLLRKPQIA